MADTTTISGTIRDAQGNVQVGIVVYLHGSVETQTTTDSAGYYEFPNLPLGRYRVKPAGTEQAFDPPVRDVNVYQL